MNKEKLIEIVAVNFFYDEQNSVFKNYQMLLDIKEQGDGNNKANEHLDQIVEEFGSMTVNKVIDLIDSEVLRIGNFIYEEVLTPIKDRLESINSPDYVRDLTGQEEVILDDITKFRNEYTSWEIKTEEQTIPITLAIIKAKCGWSEFCDVTGSNHYMLKEWTVEDSEVFNVKVSYAKQLGLI